MQTNKTFENIPELLNNTRDLPTPFLLIDQSKIKRNLEILKHVKDQTGCKILLAQKAFSCFNLYPLISQYLDGTTASGLYEAKLGHKHFGGETHVFAPAFKNEDLTELTKITNHIVFNSIAQLKKHYQTAKKAGMHIMLRVNPEHKTQSGDIYDPCAPKSRFGVRAADMTPEVMQMLDGLHFHTLCQQNVEPLIETFQAFEQKFGKFLNNPLKTPSHPPLVFNFGGGHHITREDYDVKKLITFINEVKNKYRCDIYLEPGEAVVLNSGYSVATVLDIVENQIQTAILDTSAMCNNPDILVTGHDYTPPVFGAENIELNSSKVNIRLSGNSCMTGDIIGDYNFKTRPKVGDRIVFGDTALYSTVSWNTFNGIPIPHIFTKTLDGKIQTIRVPNYFDFESRLGT